MALERIMKQVKRLDIIVHHRLHEQVLTTLRSAGVCDFSMVTGVSGHGDRGLSLADDLSEAGGNTLIITTMAPEALDALLPDLRELLGTYGGACLISDAGLLLH